jgi:hypothetical protein
MLSRLREGERYGNGTKMDFGITFLDAGRRTRDGKLWDVIDYHFRVASGKLNWEVAVGITGAFHDAAEPLGMKTLSREKLIEAATDWLRSRLENGECDPFSRPESDSTIDVPSSVMEYWMEHHEIPRWI